MAGIPLFHARLPVLLLSGAGLVGATGCETIVHQTSGSTTSSSGGGAGGTGGAPDATTSNSASSTGTGIGEPSDKYPAPHSAPPTVVTFGGPVLTTPKIVPIVFSNDNATIKGQIADFTNKIGASEYWKATTEEYGVGPATGLPMIEIATAAPTTTTDDQIQAFLKDKLTNDPTFPQPDGQTLYSVFYPSGTTITLDADKSCQSFGGYHAEFNHNGQAVPYSVVPRCNNFGGLSGIDMVTGAGSHEYVEAATDPFPYNNTAYGQVDNAHIYWLFALGGGETSDMCAQLPAAFTQFPGLDYIVQRSWSNGAAKAGHDPCQPIQDGHVYFNAAPKFVDDIELDLGQIIKVKGVLIPEGETRTVDVQLFSDGPTNGPFSIAAFDASSFGGGAPALDFSFDQDFGENGQTLHLSITVNEASQFGVELFYLISDNGIDQNMWIGVVGN